MFTLVYSKTFRLTQNWFDNICKLENQEIVENRGALWNASLFLENLLEKSENNYQIYNIIDIDTNYYELVFNEKLQEKKVNVFLRLNT